MISQVTFFIFVIFHCFLFGQQCLSDAGQNKTVCGGRKFGSNYRVYLDGTNSISGSGSINYEWLVLDEGISISTSQARRSKPYFNYPQNLSEDKEFRIQLRVFDNDQTCEDIDTVLVVCQANMCPIPDAGDDLIFSSGCAVSSSLDASNSSDPDNAVLNYQWSSLDGLDANLSGLSSSISTFTFPSISSDQTYKFSVTVDDGENFVADTIVISYLKNSSPFADAGEDFTTCEPEFFLSAKRSYDEDRNNLSYSWSLLNGNLALENSSSAIMTVTSPIDLAEDSEYHFELEIIETISGQQFCNDRDTIVVTIKENICPVAVAGKNVRVPKFNNFPVKLSAQNSYDPDGEGLSYLWTGPNEETSSEVEITVSDINPDSSFSKYNYQLKVTDSQGAVSFDEIDVTFSHFSKPNAPKIYAVADHNRVLVSWDASSEASIDSLTGYADFEGYKLYRSIDGGITWGGDEDKLYDFDGNFVGWEPYAQFDLDFESDKNFCIYSNDICGPQDPKRNTSIAGLDPFSPRFSLGINSGIEYAYIDSSVVDGIEYTYTICAYDMGLEPFQIQYTLDDSSQSYVSDTVWASTNPDKFMGPEYINYYDVYGNFIRSAYNPNRGYPYLETDKGSSPLDENFITVIPGYTPSNIFFPDERDIEAIFSSDSNNIGTGNRAYFIVDRNEISSQKLLKYEISASQGIDAVEGIAVENPLVYVYEINSYMEPKYSRPFSISDLNFFEKDSLVSLPGSYIEGPDIIVPQFQLIQPLNSWSDMMDGIRFRFDNASLLYPGDIPAIDPFDGIIYQSDGTLYDSLQVAQWFYVDNIKIELSYSSYASFLRRLNFDYEIEFFSDPVGDTTLPFGPPISLPFRITNLYTGKKVGLVCADFGSNNNPSDGIENGAGDFSWTRGEEINLFQDLIMIAGEEEAKYNFNLKIDYRIPTGKQVSMAWSEGRDYVENDTVFFSQMFWVTSSASKSIPPSAQFIDNNNDGQNDNTWTPIYPWENGTKLYYGPAKLFEDGDNWVSDMSVLGKVAVVADTTLDTIKVVPNPYIVRSRFNETPASRKLRFTNLPQECRISIYTVSGELIRVLDHFNRFDGNKWWDMRTANNQEVAPGLYIYHVESNNGQEKIGKFAVIR